MADDDGTELIGRIFDGRFKIEGILGAGGMGRVYRGVQLSIDRPVALKVLHKELAEDERQIERFNREALACSRLTHPNSIRILDYGHSEDGNLFLAMEYLDGQVLSRAIRDGGPMAPKRVARIGSQIAKALAEAHDVGLVHRDLKPANIFLCDFHGEKDFVKVLDYGIAKFTAESSSVEEGLTKQGSILGTPDYLAPEQALGLPVTAKADLYALGVVMYHMLSGITPFRADTPVAVVMKHIHEAPAPFDAVMGGSSVPEILESLVFELLTKNPSRRPGSAAAVARRLDAMLNSHLLDGAPASDASPRRRSSGARRLVQAVKPTPLSPASQELLGVLDEADRLASADDPDDLDLSAFEVDGEPGDGAVVVAAPAGDLGPAGVEDLDDLGSPGDLADVEELHDRELDDLDDLDLDEVEELDDLDGPDDLDLDEVEELDEPVEVELGPEELEVERVAQPEPVAAAPHTASASAVAAHAAPPAAVAAPAASPGPLPGPPAAAPASSPTPRWMLIGGGAVVVAVVLVLLFAL